MMLFGLLVEQDHSLVVRPGGLGSLILMIVEKGCYPQVSK
jgi:hypothetical protein